MKVILVDPNARGWQVGMDTLERSMNALVCPATSSPIFVLAHSAGGGFLVRYLLTHPDMLPHMVAIAFTDSTHNVQWTKDDEVLFEFLQSASCLYVRNTATTHSDTFVQSEDRKLGDKIQPHDIGGSAGSEAFQLFGLGRRNIA